MQHLLGQEWLLTSGRVAIGSRLQAAVEACAKGSEERAHRNDRPIILVALGYVATTQETARGHVATTQETNNGHEPE